MKFRQGFNENCAIKMSRMITYILVVKRTTFLATIQIWQVERKVAIAEYNNISNVSLHPLTEL